MKTSKRVNTNVAPSELKFGVAGDTIERGVSGIIYCDPGIGKTTLLTTLDPDTTLIINTEAGIGPLLGKRHTVFNLREDLGQLDALYKFIRTEKHPWTNICIDNISELEQWFVVVLTQGRGKDFAELSEYGNAGYKMREYMHMFRDLVEMKFNVFFTAWEMQMDIKNQSGEVLTKTYPKMFRAIAPEMCGIVDFVARLEHFEKTGDRWLRLAPQKNLMAKTQFSGLEKEEPADLSELLEKIYAYDYTGGEKR